MDEKTLEIERAALQKMIESDGWIIFARNTKTMLDNLQDSGWNSIKTLEQLHYARGCMDTMRNLIYFDKMLEVSAQEETDLVDG